MMAGRKKLMPSNMHKKCIFQCKAKRWRRTFKYCIRTKMTNIAHNYLRVCQIFQADNIPLSFNLHRFAENQSKYFFDYLICKTIMIEFTQCSYFLARVAKALNPIFFPILVTFMSHLLCPVYPKIFNFKDFPCDNMLP